MSSIEQAKSLITTERQNFGGNEIALAGADIATSAAAAHAKAMVESRYVMAMRNPRNWAQVRQDLIKECERPSFANNPSALYRKPIGAGVEGLGIRFVEVALRCMKNVLVESKMVYENDTIEVHSVTVTDLESNTTYPMDVKVSKTVERASPASDGSYISVRKNSSGKPTYTVPANDDDLLNKRASLISKAIRTLGLRIIPGDLQDEAEDIIRATRKNKAAADPDGESRKVTDSFANLNITVTMLEEYLGHPVAQCTPAQIVELRGLYGALLDGEATWKSVMENKASAEKQEKPKGEDKPKKPSATEQAKQGISGGDQQGDPNPGAGDEKPDPDFVADMDKPTKGSYSAE